MSSNSAPSTSFIICSPGDGVHKINIIPLNGFDHAELYLIGEGKEETIKLVPGKYIFKLGEVGGKAHEHIFRLTLTDKAKTVDLAKLMKSKEPTRDISESAITGQKMRASMPGIVGDFPNLFGGVKIGRVRGVAKSKSFHNKPVKDFDFGMQNPVILSGEAPAGIESDSIHDVAMGSGKALELGHIGEEVPYELPAEDFREPEMPSLPGTPFSIGASINREGSGWKPAELNVEAQKNFDGDIRLRFTNLAEFSADRLRVTVSVQGLPAIRVSLPAFAEGLNIAISTAMISSKADLGVKIHSNDSNLDGLLKLTTIGDEKSVEPIMEYLKTTDSGAGSLLNETNHDPWAATVAAIFLVSTHNADRHVDKIINLAENYPNIPDAAVLAAWVTAAYSNDTREVSEAEALKYLIAARKSGAPNFTKSNEFAKELLKSFQYTAVDSRNRHLSVEEMKFWDRRSRRRMFDSPIFIWEETDKRLRSGKLWPDFYQVIVSGDLKRELWEIPPSKLDFAAAPRVETIKIPLDKIRDVIGTGGKAIREIVEVTGARVNVEDDGTIKIASSDAASIEAAKDWVHGLTAEPEAGAIYKGKVVKVLDFGAFVNFFGNKDGLVPVSQIKLERMNHPSDFLSEGQEVFVKFMGIDDRGKARLSMKVVDQETGGQIITDAGGNDARVKSSDSNPLKATVKKSE